MSNAHCWTRALRQGCVGIVAVAAGGAIGQPASPGAGGSPPPPPLSGAPGTEPLDWQNLESPLLSGQIELTNREKFVKAGEAYFSPDAAWIIFQAVPLPEAGQEPDPVYSMYVARLARNTSGDVTGIEEPILVSTPGSANTCGWFDPENNGRVIFGSTLVRPVHEEKPGFKVGTNKYAWSFPEESEVVSRTVLAIAEPDRNAFIEALGASVTRLNEDLAKNEKAALASPTSADAEAARVLKRTTDARRADLTEQIRRQQEALDGLRAKDPAAAPDAAAAVPVFKLPDYDAECSYSPDGRFLLYSHVGSRNPDGSADADLWIYDTTTGRQIPIVQAAGYDGGPFFSPDGKYICYRSDRKGDNLLQLFVAKLKWDEFGVPVGLEWERALTDNQNVNWCPYWHPSGKFLIYGTSEIGHYNYEVFAIELSDAFMNGTQPPAEVKKKRLTFANGADVLPVFSPDGQWMMWTAQRGPMVEGDTKPSSQVWIARVGAGMNAASLFGPTPASSP